MMTSPIPGRPPRVAPWCRLRWAVLLAALAVPVAAPLAAGPGAPVRVTHPWFRYLLGTIPAGGYARLSNPSPVLAVLVGATSPACGTIEMHRTESHGGMERMVAIARVTIPPRGHFAFAPGGYHLMCMMPRMHPGGTVPVTFRFANGAHVVARFAVRGANGAPAPAGAMKMHM